MTSPLEVPGPLTATHEDRPPASRAVLRSEAIGLQRVFRNLMKGHVEILRSGPRAGHVQPSPELQPVNGNAKHPSVVVAAAMETLTNPPTMATANLARDIHHLCIAVEQASRHLDQFAVHAALAGEHLDEQAAARVAAALDQLGQGKRPMVGDGALLRPVEGNPVPGNWLIGGIGAEPRSVMVTSWVEPEVEGGASEATFVVLSTGEVRTAVVDPDDQKQLIAVQPPEVSLSAEVMAQIPDRLPHREQPTFGRPLAALRL